MAERADEIRRALRDSQIGILPLEIQSQIEDEVPLLNHANQLGRVREQHDSATRMPAQLDPHRDPSIPPKEGSPFLTKLPAEIRRQIFLHYLLPDKAKKIEPKCYAQRREAFLQQRRRAEDRTRRTRTTAQQNQQTFFQSTTHWNSMLVQPLPGTVPGPGQAPQQPPQHPAQPGAPAMWQQPPGLNLQVPNANQQAANITAPPLTSNPLNGWTGNPLQIPAPPLPPPTQPAFNIPNSAQLSQMAAISFNNMTAALGAHQTPQPNGQVLHNFITFPNGQVIHNPPSNLPLQLLVPSPVHCGERRGEDTNLQRALHETRVLNKYDATPQKLVTTLLTTNIQLCLEVSTIMYEEYTFEVHIHPDGVDFLHLDRIPTLEDFGDQLETTLGVFKNRGHFSFNRMKHIEFVFWAGDAGDRLAGLRMRESLRKLISFLSKEKEPLSSVKVRFDYEPNDGNKELGIDNAKTDEIGNFWSTQPRELGPPGKKTVWRDPRVSIMHDVYNVQLVSAPLRNLRGVHKAEIEFPQEIKDHPTLIKYVTEVSSFTRSKELSDEAQDALMLEEMIMDARRDKELEMAGAGGYYKQERVAFDDAFIPGGMLEASHFMMDENEIEEGDGLIEAFGARGPEVDKAEHHGMSTFGVIKNSSDMQKDEDEEGGELEIETVPSPGSLRAMSPTNTSNEFGETDTESVNDTFQGRLQDVFFRRLKRKWPAQETNIFDL